MSDQEHIKSLIKGVREEAQRAHDASKNPSAWRERLGEILGSIPTDAFVEGKVMSIGSSSHEDQLTIVRGLMNEKGKSLQMRRLLMLPTQIHESDQAVGLKAREYILEPRALLKECRKKAVVSAFGRENIDNKYPGLLRRLRDRERTFALAQSKGERILHITRAFEEFINSITDAIGSFISPLIPVPNKASMIMS